MADSNNQPSTMVKPEALLPPESQPISARLAAAGSRRSELEALLAIAPSDAGIPELRQLILESNVAGKSSAVSREKVWAQLRQRYVLDLQVPEYRGFAEGMRATNNPSERGLLCFLMFARTDRLFRELTLACVSPLFTKQGTPVDTVNVDDYLKGIVARHGFSWTEETRVTVRQHALSALKDFGVLVGGVKKRTARPRPGQETTLFSVRLAKLEVLTDRQVLESQWFRLLGLNTDRVIELLYVANRAGKLNFRMQADVVELSVPPLETI
ncbi:MAG: DUF1819 family protein [Candidatus Marsarchaeota archaeon]|nr:DUF1819 family protein [Candidatus Marsarchaeota archaeon]